MYVHVVCNVCMYVCYQKAKERVYGAHHVVESKKAAMRYVVWDKGGHDCGC